MCLTLTFAVVYVSPGFISNKSIKTLVVLLVNTTVIPTRSCYLLSVFEEVGNNDTRYVIIMPLQ